MVEPLVVDIQNVVLKGYEVLHVRLRGDFQFFNEPVDLKAVVMEKFTSATHAVLMDLSQLGVIDSTGLGQLAALTHRLAARRAHLVLAAVPSHLQNMFQISGMEDIFITLDTAQEAMDYLKSRLG